MLPALRSASIRRHPGGSGPGRSNRLALAGVGLVGASLVVVGPVGPTTVGIQQRAVRLTGVLDDVASDYEAVFATTWANVQELATDAKTAGSELVQQIGTDLAGYGDLLKSAISGTVSGLVNAVYGGWYGSDDGYVFGLFGGSVTNPNDGVTETGSTLAEIGTALKQGNLFNAFGYFDTWSLEAADHTLKSLLSPILALPSDEITMPTIPEDLLQTLTNIVEQFFTWENLKALFDALLSPVLSVAFGFTNGLDAFATDLFSGNIGQAFTDILKAPADLIGDLLNGYVQVNPVTGDDTPFTGLLNDGSLVQDLLVTWPQMLATALDLDPTP